MFGEGDSGFLLMNSNAKRKLKSSVFHSAQSQSICTGSRAGVRDGCFNALWGSEEAKEESFCAQADKWYCSGFSDRVFLVLLTKTNK